jgi:uncharacterized phage protein (TIGR01671 family)
MREIKFRLWNDYDKKMLNWSYLLERNLANIFTLPSYKKWLMQYTGLKDKNGTEIYEGDVVELKAENGCCNMLGKIIYDNYDLAFELIDEEGNQEALWYAEQELEVIGNIYKNPELLEER